MNRLLVAVATASLVLSIVSLGWIAWISQDPRYWFPGAYAAQGPRGEPGPIGLRGPIGPPGPVGPTVDEAISDVDFRLAEVEARVEVLESDVSALQTTTDDLTTSVEETGSTVDDICDEFSFYSGALEDIWFAAC